MSMSWGITEIYLPTKTHTTGAFLWNNCPANITDFNEIGPFEKVCLNIILRCTKTKLSPYTTYYVSYPRQAVELNRMEAY